MLLSVEMKAVRLFLVCVWGAGMSGGMAQQKPAHPDIFLITIDTLRADHLGCYGYRMIQTPALDRLASEGIRFSHAFTPSPLTNTSHVSILTGLLPGNHGVTDFGVPLSPAHSTWAQLLKMQGYQTAAFIGSVILDSRALAPGLNRGFDFYDNFPEHSEAKSRWGRVERRGLEVVQHAKTWLTGHPGRPRFVWVHLFDPHDPYEPPPPYLETYKKHPYDGEIAYADSAVGNFVAFLKTSARYQGSLIIIVGDHGEGLGEHQEDTHGIFLYDSTLHVPLILKLPGGANAGKVIDAQIQTIDILPTVLELTGNPKHQLDGESLRNYFKGSEEPGRPALGETDYPSRFGWAPLRSVREDGFEFIEAPRPELYDLHADPGELENKYEPWNLRVQNLRSTLAKAPTELQRTPAASAVGASTIAELKALGYLGPADAGSSTNVPEPSLLPDPKDKIEEQNLIHRAMLAQDDGRLSIARVALEEVLKLDPLSSIVLRQLGDLELAAGSYQSAAEYLKRARAANPRDSDLAFAEGQALEKMHDYAGARDALEAGLKLTPEALQVRLALGRIYLALKDNIAAQNQFEAAVLLQPGSREAALGLARALIGEGKFAAAISQLLPLSKSDRPDPQVFDLLAEAYRSAGKTAEAQAAESRAALLRQGLR
jgi:choline-sulfatase